MTDPGLPTMSEQTIAGGRFEFGRRLQSFFYAYGIMTLEAGGRISGYTTDNEARWELEDGWIAFIGSGGEKTVKCDSPTPLLGHQGWFSKDADCVHYLNPYRPMGPLGLTYLISTHSHNAPHTIPPLLDRLEQLGADLGKQVAVVVGYSPPGRSVSCSPSIFRGVAYASVPYNCYEYGALMALPDLAGTMNRNDPDHYWFLLHDTMELGPRFLDGSRTANRFGCPDIVYAGMQVSPRFRCGWNNLGAYRFGFIRRIQPLLVQLLDHCSRREGIMAEVGGKRAVWRMAHTVTSYPGTPKCLDKGETTYRGQPRKERYFPCVDVTKYHTLENEPHRSFEFADSTGRPDGPGAEKH